MKEDSNKRGVWKLSEVEKAARRQRWVEAGVAVAFVVAGALVSGLLVWLVGR